MMIALQDGWEVYLMSLRPIISTHRQHPTASNRAHQYGFHTRMMRDYFMNNYRVTQRCSGSNAWTIKEHRRDDEGVLYRQSRSTASIMREYCMDNYGVLQG